MNLKTIRFMLAFLITVPVALDTQKIQADEHSIVGAWTLSALALSSAYITVSQIMVDLTGNKSVSIFSHMSSAMMTITLGRIAWNMIKGNQVPVLQSSVIEDTKNWQGLDSIIGSKPEELYHVVDSLKDREKYLKMGLKMPGGLILYGAPGTGKTSLAKAMAHDLDMNVIVTAGSDFNTKYKGEGSQIIKNLFQEARKNSPCMIIIDEIDAIGSRQRLSDGSGASADIRQEINTFLSQMDGIYTSGQVIVIGTTNCPDLLDPALLRPGRFDHVIEISLPDSESRTAILNHYLSKKSVSNTVTLEAIVADTDGGSGAHLAALVDIAARHAVRNSRTEITQEDLDYGLGFIKTKIQQQKKQSPFNLSNFLRKIFSDIAA